MSGSSHVERGDFQTPDQLARDVCELLVRASVNADVIVEPTVGIGAFLVAAAKAFPTALLRGYEINEAYVAETRHRLAGIGALSRTVVACEDFFAFDWESEFMRFEGEILVLGNPPWVTNSVISAASGTNLPVKKNFLGLRGIAAQTGKSNFDISEWILIRLLEVLRGRSATIAMLCKTSAARKFLRYEWKNQNSIAGAKMFLIDAKHQFGASVDACLLLVRTGREGDSTAAIFDNLTAEKPTRRIGLAGKDVVADIDRYRALQSLDGLCSFQWRSGVKHDCAAVMELREGANGVFKNAFGEQIPLETQFVYPFLKCSDLANDRLVPERSVIITQRFVGEDTSGIAAKAPQTWSYLNAHVAKFAARKSSIYKKGVPFALFGIGDYSFAPWKVAVSGLHRSARFRVVGPFNGKPVFFDDASYLLPFQTEREASIVAAILNSVACQAFLDAILFTDSKRPLTVDLLQRLNLQAIATAAGLEDDWLKLERVSYSTALRAQQTEFAMEQDADQTAAAAS